jgi:hypothetical protein
MNSADEIIDNIERTFNETRSHTLDLIMDVLDDAFLTGNFDFCRDFMAGLCSRDFCKCVYYSALVISKPWSKEVEVERKMIEEKIGEHGKF